ncbi:MAG: hypothetical protein GY856_07205 [bacterium]|nr:hypothetical protein [bacterium]
MDESLIEPPALDALISISGGVPSELVLAVRAAVSSALHRDGKQISMHEDVSWAASQLRNPLLRLLSDEDLERLRTIHRDHPNKLPNPREESRLVHIRAALQYSNGDQWFDAHPVLDEFV